MADKNAQRSSDDDSSEQATDSDAPSSRDIIPLDQSKVQLDISRLPQEQRVALIKRMSEGLIDAEIHAAKLGTEARSLQANLNTMTNTTREASQEGTAVTVSHVQETSSSRTEVIMGNTERAQSGRLTKSQTGERDWRPYYIIGGIVAVTLIAIALANSL